MIYCCVHQIGEKQLQSKVERPATFCVLLAERADAIPGARDEVVAVCEMLKREVDMNTELLKQDEVIPRFLELLEMANLVHFVGHGYYGVQRPTRSGLLFNRRVLTPGEPRRLLRGAPIIFSNACEAGRLGESEEGSADKAAWLRLLSRGVGSTISAACVQSLMRAPGDWRKAFMRLGELAIRLVRHSAGQE